MLCTVRAVWPPNCLHSVSSFGESLLLVSLPVGDSPVLRCRFLQLRDTLSFRLCRCRMSTGGCRAAPAATAPETEGMDAARQTSVTPTSGCAWRSTSWRCPRPGPAVSALPQHPCSVGIHFLCTRVTKPGLCCRSALRGRWVQKSTMRPELALVVFFVVLLFKLIKLWFNLFIHTFNLTFQLGL